MYNDDQELMIGLKNEESKNNAFQYLVKRYQEKLYWHIRKIVVSHDDADDILQNTFIKVWKNIENFREESTLYTWLFRIATNESLTFLSSKKRRSLVTLNESNEHLMDNLLADPYFEGDHIKMKLQKAILRLPEKQRLVFNMKYFDNMKYEEMSKILKTTEGALKASFFHAVRKVEDYLNNND